MKNIFTRARRVTVLCVLTAFLIIPASVSFGQDFTTSAGAGSKALLFTFSGLSILGANAFDGGLGGKYFLSDAFAVRAALRYATAFQDILFAGPVPAGSSAKDGSQSGTRLGLSGAAEYHFLKTRVSPYAGGGLGLTYTFTKHTTPVLSPADPTITNNSRTGETISGNSFFGGTAFNVCGIAGVEFFIVKEVSLGAEYQFGYTLNAPAQEKITSTVGTTTTTTTTKFAASSLIGISAVGTLTLAVYF
jgi:opacity protein-like surface antigen